jgi:hypothetical protein
MSFRNSFLLLVAGPMVQTSFVLRYQLLLLLVPLAELLLLLLLLLLLPPPACWCRGLQGAETYSPHEIVSLSRHDISCV